MVGGLGFPNVENNAEIDELGQFAVNRYNTKERKNLKYKRVVAASQQVVHGIMYHLTIEASEGDQADQIFDVKLWQQSGDETKSLESFKLKDQQRFTKLFTHKLQAVSIEDPLVHEAAAHAVDALNAKSNSLVLYELVQITSGQAKLLRVIRAKSPITCLGTLCGKVGNEINSYELQMKVTKGEMEEDVKTEVHYSADGDWYVKHVTLI